MLCSCSSAAVAVVFTMTVYEQYVGEENFGVGIAGTIGFRPRPLVVGPDLDKVHFGGHHHAVAKQKQIMIILTTTYYQQQRAGT